MVTFTFLAILEYMFILRKLSKYRNRKETMEYEKALQFAKTMDYYASILFPVIFVLFIIGYLIYYLGVSRDVNIRSGLSELTLQNTEDT